ncbi:hypothetical protein HY573_01570 [Candidatus Parcubacteria bacterium]|nr:hypothetical protein [Candidatus Parcubacteria bacterium]
MKVRRTRSRDGHALRTERRGATRIIVAQRHQENLNEIREKVARINRRRAEKIFFTTDSGLALDHVEPRGPTLVVSGQVFGLIDFGPGSGTDLAAKVKQKNPGALFFIYSLMPDRNAAVDGVIPKRRGHVLLSKILTVSGKELNLRRLKELFPEIE